ncbi:MAG: phosphoribosylformylglycinamidine cyclo-ligase [Thermodesulfovibrionales bacterium]|nr:phosphoribosylformylglycinamidine cyclo-ligase [Thermodesulfovibrionales bacterium]
MEKLTYKKSGVDIDEAERFIKLISPLTKSTYRSEVLSEIGLFSALFKLDIKKYKEPVLISSTDGVGTKLKIAFMADKHDTVGIDLVAMCVNDILTSGAEPLFFLDYFATGKLNADKAKEVIKGIVEGCKEAGCALIGGETAEMPGFYKDNEYDLAGFVVGAVEKDEIIDGSKLSEGDVIIGVSSSGLHSNGYSLVRKIFFDLHGFKIDQFLPELNSTLAEEFLRPTKIYVDAFNLLKEKVQIKAMAHITGGGLIGNIPRVLRKGLRAVVYLNSWERPPIFELIKKLGNVPEEDLRRTFNLGIGYVFMVPEKDSSAALQILKNNNHKAYAIGIIEKLKKQDAYLIFT